MIILLTYKNIIINKLDIIYLLFVIKINHY